MTTHLITPPAALAVSLAAAKVHLRITSDDLDASIATWIEGITAQTEHDVGRSFITQGWRLTCAGFGLALRLDHPPVISIESVSYYDTDGALQVLAPAAYHVHSVGAPGFITPAPGAAWPATQVRADAVIVDYTCGYGPTEASVPACAKLYILGALAIQFDGAEGSLDDLERLLAPLQVYG